MDIKYLLYWIKKIGFSVYREGYSVAQKILYFQWSQEGKCFINIYQDIYH